MSDRKNNFEKFSANQPKRTFTGPVMDERGNKDLPPGKKGGEKMKPDLHEIHKQHTFDSFCKKVLKHEAGNGHREINRRARMEISMSDLPEEAMEQLFESAFYSNPDLRKVAPPQENAQPASIDLTALIEQLQKSPELADTLASIIACQTAC